MLALTILLQSTLQKRSIYSDRITKTSNLLPKKLDTWAADDLYRYPLKVDNDKVESVPVKTRRVRFANYFRSEDRNTYSKIVVSIPDSPTATQLNKKFEVAYQKVTDYYTIDRQINWVLIVSPTGGYLNQTLNNDVVSTLIIYGLGIPKARILTDIESPMDYFTTISDNVTVTTPYSNNTFWRIVVLNNGDCNLLTEVSRREVVSEPQDFRKIRFPNRLIATATNNDESKKVRTKRDSTEEGLTTGLTANMRPNYFLDDSYSAKDIRLNISAPDGGPSIDTVLKDVKFERFGVYTLIYSKEQLKDSFTIVPDFEPSSPYPAVAFSWLYALLWVILRKLRQLNVAKRGRTFFYQPKSIRVRNIEDKTLSSTMQLDQVDYVDTFRGLMIVLMIFIRTGGANSWLLHQSIWNGFSLGDLPKYSISWILGFCVPLSHVRIDPTQDKWKHFRNYLIRFLIMAVMGKI